MQPQRVVEILAKEEPGVQGPGEVAGCSGYPSWRDEERDAGGWPSTTHHPGELPQEGEREGKGRCGGGQEMQRWRMGEGQDLVPSRCSINVWTRDQVILMPEAAAGSIVYYFNFPNLNKGPTPLIDLK